MDVINALILCVMATPSLGKVLMIPDSDLSGQCQIRQDIENLADNPILISFT